MPSRAIDQYCGPAGRMWPSWATPPNRIRLPLPQRPNRPMLKSDPQDRRDGAMARTRAAQPRMRGDPGLAGTVRASRGRQIRKKTRSSRWSYARLCSYLYSFSLIHISKLLYVQYKISIFDTLLRIATSFQSFRSFQIWHRIAPRDVGVRLPIVIDARELGYEIGDPFTIVLHMFVKKKRALR